MLTRKCKICNQVKNIEDFGINHIIANTISKTNKKYRKHTCKDCRKRQSKTLRKLHKENPKPNTVICPICETETDKHVLDHDHLTDTFRGWLCNDCNTSLGIFKDDIKILKKAILYLCKHKCNKKHPSDEQLELNINV